jgi:hypothetical protein
MKAGGVDTISEADRSPDASTAAINFGPLRLTERKEAGGSVADYRRRIAAMISDRTVAGSVGQAAINSAKSGSVGSKLVEFTMVGASDTAPCDDSPDEFAIRSSPAELIVDASRTSLAMTLVAWGRSL